MKIDDLYEPVIATNFLESSRRVWARSGNKIVQKFSCLLYTSDAADES